MTWRSSMTTRWCGWILLYALAVWGALAGISILLVDFLPAPDRDVEDVILWGFLPIPVALAALIGLRFGSAWWTFGPPAAILVPSAAGLLAAPNLLSWPGDPGYAILLIVAAVYATASCLAAVTGVLGRKLVIDRRHRDPRSARRWLSVLSVFVGLGLILFGAAIEWQFWMLAGAIVVLAGLLTMRAGSFQWR